MELAHGSFEDETFGEGECHSLDLIGHFVHPNIIELLSFSHNLLLKGLGHGLSLSDLSVVDKAHKSSQISHRVLTRDLALGALCKLRSFVYVILNVSKDILDDLLHEDTVVTLSCHRTVCPNNTLTDASMRSISSATTSLSANCGYSLEVPSREALYCATDTDDLVFSSLWVCKKVLCCIVPQVDNN